MALLEVENLQVHFRTPEGINRAVDGVSFHVDEGETLAIVGESGCGKSVTSMSLLRLIPEPPGKVAGSVRFAEKDILQLSDREMRAIRGVSGVHIMAYRQEESVAEIVDKSAILQGRSPWYPERDASQYSQRTAS